jgi:hypothetical protein
MQSKIAENDVRTVEQSHAQVTLKLLEQQHVPSEEYSLMQLEVTTGIALKYAMRTLPIDLVWAA